ncbi:MAG: sporulation protein YunB [Coprobacillaceae bacterium]
MKKVMVGIVIFLVAILILVQVMSVRCTSVIKEIANNEVERFCQLVVNHTSFPYSNISEDVVRIERDSNNQISLIDFDMAYVSKIAGEIVLEIEELLLSLEGGVYESTGDSVYDKKLQKINDDKGVIATIPLGLLSNNPFFAEMGPNLKIRYKTISQVSSTIVKEVENYGINRMMIGISIVITIHLRVTVPFYQEEHSQDIAFPLSLEIIERQVPQWYQN